MNKKYADKDVFTVQANIGHGRVIKKNNNSTDPYLKVSHSSINSGSVYSSIISGSVSLHLSGSSNTTVILKVTFPPTSPGNGGPATSTFPSLVALG